jgi:hypothetical protein
MWRSALGCLFLVCSLLVAGEALSIGLAKKPKPQDQPADEAVTPTGGAQGTAATATQRGNRAPAEDSLPDEADWVRQRIVEEERMHLRRLAWANRIQALGIEHERPKLVDLARELRRAEEQRHQLALARLERKVEGVSASGGAP